MIKAIIIDDEKEAIELVQAILNDHCPEIEVVGTADGVEKGKEEIRKKNPDLLFLDIQMQDGTGFDLLRQTENTFFDVIFVTAYDEYAIEAFRVSALDYILKPVNYKYLLEAVNKILKDRKEKFEIDPNKLDTLFQYLAKPEVKKLAVKVLNGVEYIEIDNIIRAEADSSYSHIYRHVGGKITVARPLSELDKQLKEHGFFRAHKSHLINLNYIKKHKNLVNGAEVEMADNSWIFVSKRKKAEFLEMMKRIST